MESPVAPRYSPLGQPMLRLINSMEACHVSPDQKSSTRSPNSTHSKKGSTSTAEGMSASECSMEYLADLMREKGQLNMFPQLFPIMERLMEEEINRVRGELFQCSFAIEKLTLPEPEGDVITVQEKVYVPCKDHPDYNFVGRILGPRGNTAKQLEKEIGCKIMVRGRGSMRDHRKEEQNRGKPNWEHLDDELHVLIQCEDAPNRVYLKLKAGVEQIKKLLIPTEGSDELKRKQLMELAIINGTYRPIKHHIQGAQLVSPVALVSPLQQPPTSMAGQPIFVSPVGSPITPGSIASVPSINSYMHSPNLDYNVLFNQLSFDPSQASYSMGGGDSQPLASPFGTTPHMPSVLQSYIVDSTSITPPDSTSADRS